MAKAHNITDHPGPTTGPGHYLLDLGTPRPTLSSAAIGGGLGQRRWIFSRSVVKNWDHPDPVGDTRELIKRLGADPDVTVGLMTSVFVASLRAQSVAHDGWRVTCLATAGVGNASVVGSPDYLCDPLPGTINLVLLVEGRLTPEGLVGAVQTATEAKSLVLQEVGVTTRHDAPATGTTTDTVTVVCLQDAPCSPYAGPATAVGYAIGRSVREAMNDSLATTWPPRSGDNG